MYKLIVISGCSGRGKSTLLSELKNQGYLIVPETGREIVKKQLEINGDATPWKNPELFCEMAIERSVSAFYHAIEITSQIDNPPVFFDRCFLDIISYYKTLKTDDSTKYDSLIRILRFHKTVYMAPPWKENFSQDEERKHSFEDAVIEYERLLVFYAQSGYSVIELPKVSVKERLKFLTSSTL